MALAFVGSAQNAAANGASVTLTLPGGIAAGDAVYVAIGVGTNDSTNFDMAMTTAGYTELADLFQALGGGRQQNFGLYRKVMGATPDSTAVTTGRGTTGNGNVAVCHVWSGADSSTPEDATPVTAGRTGASTPVNSQPITTVTAGAVVLTIGSATGGTVFSTPTAPSGYGNLINRGFSGNTKADNSVAMASKSVASPGTEDPGDFGSFNPGSSDTIIDATVAIRPAPTNPVLTFSKFRVYTDTGLGTGEAA